MIAQSIKADYYPDIKAINVSVVFSAWFLCFEEKAGEVVGKLVLIDRDRFARSMMSILVS